MISRVRVESAINPSIYYSQIRCDSTRRMSTGSLANVTALFPSAEFRRRLLQLRDDLYMIYVQMAPEMGQAALLEVGSGDGRNVVSLERSN